MGVLGNYESLVISVGLVFGTRFDLLVFGPSLGTFSALARDLSACFWVRFDLLSVALSGVAQMWCPLGFDHLGKNEGQERAPIF